MSEEVSISHIVGLLENLNNTQLGVTQVPDSDLGYNTWGGKDNEGNITRWLAKDEGARVLWLDLVSDGISSQVGRIFWSSDEGCPVVGMSSSVNLQIGQELYGPKAKNDQGAILPNGTVVRLTGGVGVNPLIQVSDPDNGINCTCVGITTEEFAINGFGYYTTHGLVRDINTSAFSPGDTLWLDDDGGITLTQPDAPRASVRIGHCVTSHASDGIINAEIRGVPYLSYLSDVNARGATHNDGDVLAWDDANSRWDLSAAVLSIAADGEPGSPLANDVKLYAGSNIYLAQGVDGIEINAILDEVTYVPSSLNLVTGTYTSGSVSDVQNPHDGNDYIIGEVAGVPGYNLEFNFTNVLSFNRLRYYYNYSGSGAHTVEVQMYDYNTTTWDKVADIGPPVGDYNFLDIAVSNSMDYIDGSGNAKMRVYHVSSGNPSEVLSSDYVALVNTFGGSSSSIWLSDYVDDGTHLTPTVNNHLMITTTANAGKDHDRNQASTDPVLYLFGSTDVDSDNTDWVSFSKTAGDHLEVDSGDYKGVRFNVPVRLHGNFDFQPTTCTLSGTGNSTCTVDWNTNFTVVSMAASEPITSVIQGILPVSTYNGLMFFRVNSYGNGNTITGFPSNWEFGTVTPPFTVDNFKTRIFTIIGSSGGGGGKFYVLHVSDQLSIN